MQTFANCIFNFESCPQHFFTNFSKKHINKPNIEEKKFLAPSPREKENSLTEDTKRENLGDPGLHEKLKKKRIKLKLTFFEKIVLVLGIPWSRWRIAALKSSVERIKEYTDIVFIMKKLVEFEKLKEVVFDQKQLEIFNYITHVKSSPANLLLGNSENYSPQLKKTYSEGNLNRHLTKSPRKTIESVYKMDDRLMELVEKSALLPRKKKKEGKFHDSINVESNSDIHGLPRNGDPILLKKNLEF